MTTKSVKIKSKSANTKNRRLLKKKLPNLNSNEILIGANTQPNTHEDIKEDHKYSEPNKEEVKKVQKRKNTATKRKKKPSKASQV